MIVFSFIAIAFFKVFDELEQHAWQSKFQTGVNWLDKWLNTNTGWVNKHNWKPSWLFKTALVFTTDGEHFFQMLKHLMIALSFAPVIGWWFIAVYLTIALVSFLMNEIVL